MTRRQWPVLAAIPMLTIALGAQQPPPPAPPPQQPQAQGQGQGRGGRGQQTPAQREAAAREAHEREAAVPRPVPARDSVWIEELTYLEVRDAIKAGKTTALIMAGSTEQNGPYMSGGKHQYAIRLVGEAVARKLGNALIAPVIPIEAGNPENPYLEWGSLYFTAETFQSVVRDMATSLKSQGFQNIVLLGDSGGDTAGLRAVAQELSAKWTGGARIFHVPEYYNWTSPGGVRQFVNDNGIPENATAEGIHDEYGLTAVMMVNDPKIVRYDERVAAEKATINGIAIAPKEKTIEMGKKIVEFRAERRGRGDQEGTGHAGGIDVGRRACRRRQSPLREVEAEVREPLVDQHHDLRAVRRHRHEDHGRFHERVGHGLVMGLYDDVRREGFSGDGTQRHRLGDRPRGHRQDQRDRLQAGRPRRPDAGERAVGRQPDDPGDLLLDERAGSDERHERDLRAHAVAIGLGGRVARQRPRELGRGLEAARRIGIQRPRERRRHASVVRAQA